MDLQQVTTLIEQWMQSRSNNSIEPGVDRPAFGVPLVGCASGADPLFSFLKEDIHPTQYWLPREAFQTVFSTFPSEDAGHSVISWVLPQTEHTRSAHRRALELPSREWSCGRHYGEHVNENLRRFVVEVFRTAGIRACAPALLPQWSRIISPHYGFASRWSERHTAYVCGLGTFGLSDGLITPLGKSIRVGSVVVETRLQPTSRPYSTHTQWCLFHAKGKCKACIQRCPVGAISEDGHDKAKCKAYIREVTALHVKHHQLGFKVNSCGLCQTNVPCEKGIPKGLSTD